jgi:DNA-binding transcriptional LysR family regulator
MEREMTREIDLSLLRAFVAVSETSGMTAAGRHLNLTQAAVSQQIKRLEEQFDTELFDRSQRHLAPTASGERLFAHAERILSLNDEIWGLMTSRGFEGQVRIGVPHDIVGVFMPKILRGFAKAWPRVEVSLDCSHSTALLRALDRGEIDLIVTTEAEPNERSQLLLSDQLVWVGSPGGSAHERSPLPVTLGDEQCTFRAAAVKGLGAMGRDWRFTCASSTMSAFRATLEADLAVAPLLSQTVPEELEILGAESGLPALPIYYINLYLAPTDPSTISLELAKHITRSFAIRHPKAA